MFAGSVAASNASATSMGRLGFAEAEDGTWTLDGPSAEQLRRLLSRWHKNLRQAKQSGLLDGFEEEGVQLAFKISKMLSSFSFLNPYSRATVGNVDFYARKKSKASDVRKYGWCVLRNDNGEDGLRIGEILCFYTHVNYLGVVQKLAEVHVYLSIDDEGKGPLLDPATGAPVFRKRRDLLHFDNQATAMYPLSYICPIRICVADHPTVQGSKLVLCRQLVDAYEAVGLPFGF